MILLSGGRQHLFPVVGDRGQDGAQRLDAHGDIQQVSSEEEVVVVSQQGRQHVPAQVQEGLREETKPLTTNSPISWGSVFWSCGPHLPVLTLSVNTTPNFQIWYLMSMAVTLWRIRLCSSLFFHKNVFNNNPEPA